ncbi:MAG: carbohydrate ABC transporter permease [Chloroflexota bacterium]
MSIGVQTAKNTTTKKTTLASSARQFARRRWFNSLFHATSVYILLIIASFVFLLPFIWMMLTAVKSAQEASYFPPTIIPQTWQWTNFAEAWMYEGMKFSLWAWNTVLISAVVLAGTLITSSLCAYGFARIQFPGSNFWFIATIASVMLPPQVTLIPLYVLFFKIGWLNTFAPLTVPAWFGGGALNIFLLRQFFMQLPAELEDAAYIDGANRLQIWLRIFLPLSIPALLTVGIFTFQATWNDFFGPLIFLTGRDKYTLALGMNLFNSQYGSEVQYMMAIAFLMTIPMIVVFFAAQKYFVGGIVLSGVNR